MVVVEYHNIELDMCPGCRGVWFDSGELQLMFKLHNSEDIGVFIEKMVNKPDIATTEKKRKCPICGKTMSKKDTGETPQLLIDVCGRGHGLWFDGGEVVQLASQVGKKSKFNTGNEAVKFLEEFFSQSK